MECAVLVVAGGCVVILAVIALGFYAMRKMRPGSFRVRATLLRLFTFSMEIESPRSSRTEDRGRTARRCGPRR